MRICGILFAAALAGCVVSSQSPTVLRDLRPVLRQQLDGKPRAERLAVLTKALADPSPSARLAAARILGREYVLEAAELRPLSAALRDSDPEVRAEVARGLLLQLPLSLAPIEKAGPAALPPG